jgi:hypothetical protein
MRRTCVLTLLLAGCSAGTEGLVRRQGPEYAAEVDSWLRAIDAQGGDGMWLIVRGYHPGDDTIAVATNSDLSHAAVLDLSHREVIEAVGKGVVVTPLERFVNESHRVRLVRPNGWSPDVGEVAVARARERVGAKYDYGGILGMPDQQAFYCSELAAWSMGMEVDQKSNFEVLHPKHLHDHGTILFDSGPRDGQPDAPPAE